MPQSPRHAPDVNSTELIGGREKRDIVIVDADPTWPATFETHRARITTALADVLNVGVEHIGSTSVPGLGAKPIIDILVTVEDITAEDDYLSPLLEAGYELRVREPAHRMVRTPGRDVHVHIVEIGDQQATDYLDLRDHLRRHPDDRALYERTKRALAQRDWDDVNEYADAKSDVIAQILERARNARVKSTP